jgi:hypothetical protein
VTKTRENFNVFGVILASASPVLDAMLCSGMVESQKREIRFTKKDPSEWKLIMECIDSKNALLLSEDHNDDDVLNGSNVRALIPWFDELQMEAYLTRCDKILDEIVGGFEDDISTLIEDLSFATRFNLHETRNSLERSISNLLEQFCWGLRDELFNINIIQKLVEVMAPLKFQDNCSMNEVTGADRPAKKQRCLPHIEPSHCSKIWHQISSCLEMDLLCADTVIDKTCLSHLIHYALQQFHKSMKSNLDEIIARVGKKTSCHLKIDCDHTTYNKYLHFKKIDAKGTNLTADDITSAMKTRIYASSREQRFSRRFQLSGDCKTISLVCRLDKDDTVSSIASKSRFAASQTNIRSSETDLTVRIGTGESMKLFQCHRAILAFASTKLDSLVTESKGGVLLLPHLSPKGWDLFYECISPRQVKGVFLNCWDEIHSVKRLVPWFREFGMKRHLKCAADILKEYLDNDNELDIPELLQLLQLAVKYELKEVKEGAEAVLKCLFEDVGVLKYSDICQKTVHGIVRLCLPIQRSKATDPFTSSSCPVLFEGLTSCIGDHLKSLTLNKIKMSDGRLFSHLVHSFICRKLESHNNSD